MSPTNDDTRANIETACLRLANGWKATVVTTGPDGQSLSGKDWAEALADPERLFERPEHTIKVEGLNRVIARSLPVGPHSLAVVVKRHYPQPGLRSFFRSFGQGRALASFKKALRLLGAGIPVAFPLAALHQRRNLRTIQSIYICRLIPDSPHLQKFLAMLPSQHRALTPATKKQLCLQLAGVLAALHNNGLWHRDSKASNFLVAPEEHNRFRICLVDTDGIKRYGLSKEKQQQRTLWRLAASMMGLPSLTRTDFFRVFKIYCDLTAIDPAKRPALYRRITAAAKEKYEHIHTRQHPKILLIKPSSLGDIVLALPVLSALRRNFPKAHISWLIRPEFAGLLEGHPHLDRIIHFDRKLLGKAWYHPRAFAALVRLVKTLRDAKFDLVIDLQGLFRTAALAWLTGSEKRLGMAQSREFAHFFYTVKVAPDADSIHQVDYYLKVVQSAGALDLAVEFILPADPLAEQSARGLLETYGISRSEYAVIVPGSAHPDKCWPAENFAVLARRISSEFGIPVVATGTASEKHLIERIQETCPVAVCNLAGKTNLKELVALLRNARIVVSNDTGPGHIAGALDVPLVLIFGRSNPARVYPYNHPECVVAVEPDTRGIKANSFDPRYHIDNVTVKQVWRKVRDQLKLR